MQKVVWLSSLIIVLWASCGGGKKPQAPRVSPIAQLPDTSEVAAEAMGTAWYRYTDQVYRLRMKVPRLEHSDIVNNDGTVEFMSWSYNLSDTMAYKAGLVTYLVGEKGFLLQVYKRPYQAFGQEFYDFEELGAEVYRMYAGDRLRTMENGQFIMLQDSTKRAFAFDTQVDFGQTRRTPLFYQADRLYDAYEMSLERSPARVVYLSHKGYNFRIIYERGNPLATGIFSSLYFE